MCQAHRVFSSFSVMLREREGGRERERGGAEGGKGEEEEEEEGDNWLNIYFFPRRLPAIQNLLSTLKNWLVPHRSVGFAGGLP